MYPFHAQHPRSVGEYAQALLRHDSLGELNLIKEKCFIFYFDLFIFVRLFYMCVCGGGATGVQSKLNASFSS